MRSRTNELELGNVTPHTASNEMTIVDDQNKEEETRLKYEKKKTMGGFKKTT